MGFLDKVKNLFTEEIEEEEIKPQKREVKPVETSLPKREQVITPPVKHKEEEIIVTESKIEENKEKFVFPVYFDDKDFDDLEKPKVKEQPKKVEKKEETKKEPYQGAKVTIQPEPKKIFKPSPIISPVYGILDKNYSKDDITTKQDRPLEDDLEITMSYDFSEIEEKPRHEAQTQEALEIFNELNFEEIEEKEKKETVAYEELEKNLLLEKDNLIDDDTEELARQLEEQKKKLEEISQYINENEVPDKETVMVPDEYVEEKNDSVDSNLNDSELFDLIDSMYEKEEDE